MTECKSSGCELPANHAGEHLAPKWAAETRARMRGASPQGISARTSCSSHPDFQTGCFDDHEPLSAEMRCAYCGERLMPETCGQCGKFMTAVEMHEAFFGGVWRCSTCA